MGNIILIAAMANNNAIGRNGDMPWHVPEDLAHFQRMTQNGLVIMGRKTWDSLPKKPLPKRVNLIISREKVAVEGALIQTMAQAKLTAQHHDGDVFIIGGGEIYKAFLPLAHQAVLTHLDLNVEADTFFPNLDKSLWDCTEEATLRKDAPRAIVRTWKRREA